MPIQRRFKQRGDTWSGTTVIVCHYCGKDIENVDDGLAVPIVIPSDAPEPIIRIGYAHIDCEQQYLRSQGSEEAAMEAAQMNIPLGEFFGELHKCLRSQH